MIQTDRYRAFYPRTEDLEHTIETFLTDLRRLYPDTGTEHFNISVKAKPAFLVDMRLGTTRDPGAYAVTLTARRKVTRA
jgi:hypothetical protein